MFSFITSVNFTTSILLPNYRMGGNYKKQRSKDYYAMTFALVVVKIFYLKILLKNSLGMQDNVKLLYFDYH